MVHHPKIFLTKFDYTALRRQQQVRG